MDARQIADLWEPLADKIGRPKGLLFEPDGPWCPYSIQAHDSKGVILCSTRVDSGIAAALWRDHATRWLLSLDRGAAVDRACLMMSRTGDKYHSDTGRTDPFDHESQMTCCDQPDIDRSLAASCAVAIRWQERVTCPPPSLAVD